MTEHERAPQNSVPDHQWTSHTWRPVLILGAVVLVAGLLFSNQPYSLGQDEKSVTGDPSFSDLAIMGGVKRTNLSKDFRSGEATAVMGGVDIDLRDAVMDRSEAVLDVSSVMGGVQIRVPKDWSVVSHVNTIMGGFKDDTRHPSNEDHRLVLKGTVVMGGIKIMN